MGRRGGGVMRGGVDWGKGACGDGAEGVCYGHEAVDWRGRSEVVD